MMTGLKIHRLTGAILIALYIAYIAIQFIGMNGAVS
jgi:Ca2+/Na+ antiporter